MKLIPAAIGIGVAAWALSRALRSAERSRKPEGTPEAVTRWEGEGGAIPEVESHSAAPYSEGRVPS